MGKKIANNGTLVADPERYAPTSWANKPKESEPYEYETDSGQLCLLKNIGMTDILRMGLLDTLDFFSASLAEDDKKGVKVEAPAGEDFTRKLLGNFDKMETTINKVLMVGVIAPVLQPVPEAHALRKEGLVYVDQIPFEDRVELFTEILDTEGLSDFREEEKSSVGHVPAEQVVQLPAE